MGKREAIRRYIAEPDHVYRASTKTDHSYREYLSSYVKSVLPDFDVTNEPGKIERGFVLDYAIRPNNIPLGRIIYFSSDARALEILFFTSGL